jgi:hypothetical protein
MLSPTCNTDEIPALFRQLLPYELVEDSRVSQQNVDWPVQDTEPEADADAALELAVREAELEWGAELELLALELVCEDEADDAELARAEDDAAELLAWLEDELACADAELLGWAADDEATLEWTLEELACVDEALDRAAEDDAELLG